MALVASILAAENSFIKTTHDLAVDLLFIFNLMFQQHSTLRSNHLFIKYLLLLTSETHFPGVLPVSLVSLLRSLCWLHLLSSQNFQN